MALQRDETNRLAEERVQVAAMVKEVKQQIWAEMGGTSRGGGNTPSISILLKPKASLRIDFLSLSPRADGFSRACGGRRRLPFSLHCRQIERSSPN